jgi:hypothetical protein
LPSLNLPAALFSAADSLYQTVLLEFMDISLNGSRRYSEQRREFLYRYRISFPTRVKDLYRRFPSDCPLFSGSPTSSGDRFTASSSVFTDALPTFSRRFSDVFPTRIFT